VLSEEKEKKMKKIENEKIKLSSFYDNSTSVTGSWLTNKNLPTDVMKDIS
jgi:hypothetical protein